MKRKKTAIMKKEGGRERSRDRRKIKMPEDGKMDQTKKVLCRVLMASLLVAAYFGKTCYIHRSYQEDIAKRVLRFHVLANSDSEEDQALKLKVRDAVGSYMAPKMKEASDVEDCERIVEENMQKITAAAEEVIREEGYDYTVTAQLGDAKFPVKTYGAYTFPAGTYEALNLVIGAGEGHNWWCVMYPNMCFSGEEYEVVDREAKEALQQALTPEEYASLMENKNYEVSFKYLTFLNKDR